MQIKAKHAVIAALLLGVGYYVWKKRKSGAASGGSEERSGGGGGGFSTGSEGKAVTIAPATPSPTPIVVINSAPPIARPASPTVITYSPNTNQPRLTRGTTPTTFSSVVSTVPTATTGSTASRGADGSYLNSEGFYN